MSKRGADVQLEKTGRGFPGDGSTNSGPDSNMPQKATAAQMAKRKVLTGRRGAATSSQARPPSFNAAPAAANGINFQQNSNVNTGLFGQPNVAPPSSGFSFNSAGSFNFGGTAGSSAPSFGASSNPGSSAGYTGSLFQIPAVQNITPENGHLFQNDPNRKLSKPDVSNVDAPWAPNSPFHNTSQSNFNNALTGTASSPNAQASGGFVNSTGGLFGQMATSSQPSSSSIPTSSGSSFSSTQFPAFGNNGASSPSASLFQPQQSQSQPQASSFSTPASSPSFGQGLFAPASTQAPSSGFFASSGARPNSSGSATANASGSSQPSSLFSQPATTPGGTSQPFSWPPQQPTQSGTSSPSLFSAPNTQASTQSSTSSSFDGFAAQASPTNSTAKIFGGLGASSPVKPKFDFSSHVQTSPDGSSMDTSSPEVSAPIQFQPISQTSGTGLFQTMQKPTETSPSKSPFNFGKSSTQGAAPAASTGNMFQPALTSSQSQPQQNLFSGFSAPKTSQPETTKQSLFSDASSATSQTPQSQQSLFSSSHSGASQNSQNNAFANPTTAPTKPSQQSLFSNSVSGAQQASQQSQNSLAGSASSLEPQNNISSSGSTTSQALSQQSTSLFSTSSEPSPKKTSLKQPANTFGGAPKQQKSNSLFSPAQPASNATLDAKQQSPNNMFTSKQSISSSLTSFQSSNNAFPQLDSAVLKAIKAQCISLMPQTFPEGLTEAQGLQFLLGYRMKCLEKGLRLYVASVLEDAAELSRVALYYQAARTTIFSVSGVKRRASNAGFEDGRIDQSKRVNVNGPVTNGVGSKAPLFGFPTAEKRKADNERQESPKKSKGGEVSYPPLPETSNNSSSQTSRLFANLTNAANNSAIVQPPATPAKSANATSFFSTTPAQPPPSNILGTLSQTGNKETSSAPFSFKAPSFGSNSSSDSGKVAAPASGTNFLSQFGQKAQLTEAEEKAKRKANDFDSDEETEEQWEKRDAQEQRKKKEALASATTLKVPSFGSASSSRSASPGQSDPQSAQSVGFFAQFGKKAQMTEAEEKAKRKAEEYDSEEETEEQWEKRDTEEQRKKKKKLLEQAKSEGFKVKPSGTSPALSATSGGSVFSQPADALSTSSTPNHFEHLSQAGSDAEGSKTGDDADHEDSYEDEEGEDGDAEAEGEDEEADDSAKTPTAAHPGRSLFDRIERDSNGNPKKDLFGFANASKGADSHGANLEEPSDRRRSSSEQPKSSLASSSGNIFGSGTSTPKAGLFTSQMPNSGNLFSFGAATAGKSSLSPKGDHTWKPETPIKFGSSLGASAPTVSITSPSPTKPLPEKKPLGGLFGTPKGEVPAVSSTAASTSTFTNPFAHLSGASTPAASPAPSVGFNFGSPAKPNTNTLAPTSVLASATTSRATTPGMTTGEESAGEDTSPSEPQLDLSSTRSGEEHEDVLFTVKTKAREYAAPADDAPKEWLVRGVGELRVLRHRDTNKVRMVIRAGPTSKVVMNVGLLAAARYDNPSPKSVGFLVAQGKGLQKWMLQVGKEADAKELATLLEKNKNN